MSATVYDSDKKLSLKNKIGQISQNLLGWDLYLNNGQKFSEKFHEELKKYGTIGYIYGLLRSDPWSGVNAKNGIDPAKSAKVLNQFQSQIIKQGQVPALFVEEAPHGHQGLGATCLPVNLAVGATFNEVLYGQNIANVAQELRAKGAHVALLSCLDLALDPRWGRSEECYGEDTFLAMQMTTSAVKNFQSLHDQIPSDKVAVVVKHFIAQGSSMGGHNGTSVSMGTNELRAHHLPIMKAAIDQKVAGCMVAYNDIDKIPCHANSVLIKDMLIKKMKHQGIIMSDGCGIDDLINLTGTSARAIGTALEAGVGVDLWNKSFNHLKAAIEQKHTSLATLDHHVKKTIALKQRLNLFADPFQDEGAYAKLNWSKHQGDNLKLAKESIVLLKNNGILPLKNLKNTCIIGFHTQSIYHLLGDYSAFGQDEGQSLKNVFDIPYHPGVPLHEFNDIALQGAIKLAKKHKRVILCLGTSSTRDFNLEFAQNGAIKNNEHDSNLDCGEGADVAQVSLSASQVQLFNEIKKVASQVIVIIVSGRALGLSKIVNKSSAILQCFYGGSQSALAIKETILGRNNPSGRLPVSLPINSAQLPVYYWGQQQRTYCDQSHLPLFEFGFGLSYANISEQLIGINKIVDHHYQAEIVVENHSDILAMHAVLIFAQMKQTRIKAPNKQLVGFKKVKLLPYQKASFKIDINTQWLFKNYDYQKIEFNLFGDRPWRKIVK